MQAMKVIGLKSNAFLWRLARPAFLFALAAALCLLVADFTPARAQESQATPDSLALQADQERYRLGPYLYVTRDPSTVLNFDNYAKLVERHLAGDRGELQEGNILNLGAARTPHWVIFTVNNQSWTERWVLSFGQRMDGRVGLIEELFLYDDESKHTYINTLKSAKSPYVKEEKLGGNSLVLNIPRGKKTLVFAYIVPRAGMPTTLAPELMTEKAYMLKLTSPVSQTNLISFSMVLIGGFFLAAVLFRRFWTGTLFMAYFGVLLVLFRHQNDFIQMDLPMAEHIPGLLFNLAAVIGLLMTRAFLGIGKLQRLQSRLIFGFIIALFLCSGSATFLIPDISPSQVMLMYFPPMAALLFMFMLSLAQGYTDQPGGFQMALGWFIVLACACLSFVSLMNIFIPSALMINAYWYSVIVQGVLLAGATVVRFYVEEREEEMIFEEQRAEQQSVSGIMQSKEASENARLLRMIEHEREVMNELRVREAQQNEEMRRAKEDAILANNAKSAFLAVISHEIRTPMTGIMGMVRFLLETNLTKEQRGYAQTLQDSGEAMLSLLNDILDFEKIESGKMDLEHIDFDLHRLINGVKTLMTGHAEAKNIQLKVNLHPDVPRFVIGDPVRLRQVILNLTGNSIKFTSAGGVTIDIRPERGTAGAGGVHRIRVSVIDTGVGISKEAQKNLFNPFSQADSSVARKFGGTGLGLAISQKLIEAMGGRIEIDSTEGHGSTFFFTLVAEQGSAEAVEKAEASGGVSSQKPTKQLGILIVEDNEISQKLMKELVDRMGHLTSTAGSGEEALKIMEQKDFDLILMDIQLPGMTGMGTTKAIRALGNRSKAGTPVIALTGNVRDEDVRQCYAANMNGHLAKPIDPKKLKDQIARVIDGKLDNPVELPQEKRDEHTQFTQLNVGKDKFGPRVTAGLMTNDEPDDKPAAIIKPAEKPQVQAAHQKDTRGGRDDVAPITALAMNQKKTSFQVQFTDDELDEDSFESALGLQDHDSPLVNGDAHIFNPATLGNLRNTMGGEKFTNLISDMFANAEKLVIALGDAQARQDIKQIAERAHELKGMAGNFGLTELSAIAGKAELAAKNNETAALGSLIAGLPDAHERAQAALDAWTGKG